MNAPQPKTVEINGHPCRIWEKGTGKAVYWLQSSALALKWTPFHEAMAAEARLVAISLPGFPGSTGHDVIDDHLSWFLAARDLLVAAGFQPGDTLVGSSAAGAIAADVAALWPDLVGRLVLVSPHGLYDRQDPTRDMFALQSREVPGTFCVNEGAYKAQVSVPEGTNPVLWQIELIRGNEAAARFLWPLGDTRVSRRLGYIKAPTLLLWGDSDRILPFSYAGRFAERIADARIETVTGAGHLAELDQPATVAAAILAFAAAA